MLTKKQRRIFVIIVALAMLGLLLTSFLPYLSAF